MRESGNRALERVRSPAPRSPRTMPRAMVRVRRMRMRVVVRRARRVGEGWEKGQQQPGPEQGEWVGSGSSGKKKARQDDDQSLER